MDNYFMFTYIRYLLPYCIITLVISKYGIYNDGILSISGHGTGLQSVPIFPGQSQFFYPVPGVPARGEMSRFLERKDLNRKHHNIALKPLNLKGTHNQYNLKNCQT